MSRMGFWGMLVVALATAAAVASVGLIVVAAVRVLRDRTITWQAQLVWLVTIVALPVGGALAWFAVGHRTREFQRTFAR